jgi:hypothetical protein
VERAYGSRRGRRGVPGAPAVSEGRGVELGDSLCVFGEVFSAACSMRPCELGVDSTLISWRTRTC